MSSYNVTKRLQNGLWEFDEWMVKVKEDIELADNPIRVAAVMKTHRPRMLRDGTVQQIQWFRKPR